MRTELKAKFLQHLVKKSGNKGFTLIELLVVIIIIGILAAIALPNFLSQSAKAKQTEAKQNVALVNRLQTAYRSENANFTSSFDVLAAGTLSGTGATTSTSNYSYTLTAGVDTTTVTAAQSDPALKSYSGGTDRYTNTANASVIASTLCESKLPGAAGTAPTFPSSSAPACPGTYNALGQ